MSSLFIHPNTLIMKTLFTLLLVLVLVIPASVLNAQNYELSPDMGTKYEVKILDEHAVLLINKGDTITLLLENATALADEYCIYLRQGSRIAAVKTKKIFKDSKGIEYPVWKSANSKYFYLKKSAKTDKPYKVYLSPM